MKQEQKALIIKDSLSTTHGLDELNVHLKRGWRVAHLAPMGATGNSTPDATSDRCFAAIVIIERTDQEAADIMIQMEEDVEELIEDMIESEMAEGDGATLEVEENDLGPAPRAD